MAKGYNFITGQGNKDAEQSFHKDRKQNQKKDTFDNIKASQETCFNLFTSKACSIFLPSDLVF